MCLPNIIWIGLLFLRHSVKSTSIYYRMYNIKNRTKCSNKIMKQNVKIYHICLHCLICCTRQYAYWLDPDMLDNLQPVSWVFHTRQHSTWMDANIYVYSWWNRMCNYHHYAACIFILEISYHALCTLVWLSCKWVLYHIFLPLVIRFSHRLPLFVLSVTGPVLKYISDNIINIFLSKMLCVSNIAVLD